MKLVLDDYIHLFMKDNDYRSLSAFDDSFFKSQTEFKKENESYVINWGENLGNNFNYSVMETGFFFDAVHLDKNGLYQFSSLNLNGIRDVVENYIPPQPLPELKSKFRQPAKDNVDWKGVVLACQHPTDRSVLKVGNSKHYFEFVKEAAVYYGKNLFVKLHPVNSKETEDIIRGLCEPHGATVGKVNLSVLDHCEFVVTYNSTFVVDCLRAKKRVNQYAPGYFWKCGAVNYTNRNLSDEAAPIDEAYMEKFVEFLAWKYCFHRKDNMANWNTIFKIFSESKEDFPLPEGLSYAQYILNNDSKRTP